MAATTQVSTGRFATWISLASGLIVASCISAFPSASCAATADTYVLALQSFGSAAIFIGLAAALLNTTGVSPIGNVQHAIGSVFLVVGMLMFACTAIASLHNLRLSTEHCLVGNVLLHDHIPLARSWEIWVWL